MFDYFEYHIFPWVVVIFCDAFPCVILFICNFTILCYVSKACKRGTNFQQARNSSKQLTVTLVCTSFAYLILVSPNSVLFFLLLTEGLNTNDFFFIVYISQLLYYTNNCINFVIYCASGSMFRRQLWRMLNRLCMKHFSKQDCVGTKDDSAIEIESPQNIEHNAKY